MFGQSLLSGAFGSALDPGLYFNNKLYDGTGTVQSIGGKIKGAASFNGSNSGIVVPGNMGTLLGNEFSVSFWFYTPATFPSSGYPTFVSLYGYPGSGSAYGWSIEYPNSGKIMFYWVSSNSVGNNIQSSALTSGEWCHVIVTKDSTSANIYINNVLDNASTSVSSNAMWYNGFEHFTVGCKQTTGASGATSGHISDPVDQMRIFTSVLTSAERAAVYAEDSSTANTLNFPTGAGCVAGYTFDANANTVGFDATTDISTCDFPTGAGCEALYQFENNVNNTCSGSFNPQENGITYTSGLFSDAATFSGGNSSGGDYIKMDNSVYGASTTIFSWSLWINCDNSTGTGVNIMGNGALAGGQTGYCVYLYNGRLAMSTLQSSDEYFPNPESGGTLINDGQWHHIVLAYNNGPFVLYLDGSPYQTATSSNYTGNATPASSTYIGNTFERSIAAGVVNGQIDQVRIFSTVLTQSQVTELFRGAQYNGISSNVTYNGFLNFQPDLVWQKSYSTAGANHLLTDSVRGAPSNLFSNDTSAATTNGMGSLDPNGFTTQTNTAMNNDGNVSGQNYITWNWKAGGAPPRAGVFSGTCASNSSSYIALSNAIIGTATSDLTVSFWMKGANTGEHMCQSAMAGYYTKFNIMTAPSSGGNAGKIRLNFGNGSNSEISIYGTDTGWTNGNWHHLAFTMDWNGSSFDIKLYKDGVLDTLTASDTSAVTVGVINGDVALGGFVNNGTAYGCYNGELDQVRFYDSVLSASDVTALYNETFADSSNINFPTGKTAKALYRLSGNAKDETGSYDGTTSNMQFEPGGIFIGDFQNNNGTIPSTVSANQDAGFSIVKYTGNGINGATVGHGLSALPDFILIKNVDITKNWMAWHRSLSGELGYLDSNDLFASSRLSWSFNGTQPSASLVTIGGAQNDRYTNGSGDKYIMYCWNSVAKYSKMGSYTGTGGTLNIDCGFQPIWVMIKRTDSAGNWVIVDEKRASGDNRLYADLSNAQDTGQGESFTATGFSPRNSTTNDTNTAGGNYIYMAFAAALT